MRRAPFQQAGHPIVDLFQGERLISAKVLHAALRPGAVASPDLHRRIPRRTEQDHLPLLSPGLEQQQGIGLVKAGEIVKIAVLTEGVFRVPVAGDQTGAGDQRHAARRQRLQ